MSISPQNARKNAVAVVEIALKPNPKRSQDLLTEWRKANASDSTKLAAPNLYLQEFLNRDKDKSNLQSSGDNVIPAKNAEYTASLMKLNVNPFANAPEAVKALSEPPTLVALLPQEKTYNVATITRDVKSAGLGAVVGAFNVGLSGSSSKETLYLVKDIDTVALQKPTDPTAVSFGWHFKPVLGRLNITPGIRQVFAVLSLPSTADEFYCADMVVTTRWYKWDKGRSALGSPLTPPVVKTSGFTITGDRILEDSLIPQVLDIDWEEAGSNLLRVNLRGQNFAPDTTLRIGANTFSRQASTLEGSGETRLLVMPPVDLVATGNDPLIVTHFGTRELRANTAIERETAARLLDPVAAENNTNWGLAINNANATLVSNDTVKVSVRVVTQDGKDDLRQNRLLALIGNQIFGLKDKPFLPTNPPSEKKSALTLEFWAPLSLVRANPQVTVRRPFWGKGYVATRLINLEPLVSVSALTNLGAAPGRPGKIQVALSGTSFDNTVVVQLGADEFKYDVNPANSGLSIIGDTLLYLYPTGDQLTGAKQLVVTKPSPAGAGADRVAIFKLAELPKKTSLGDAAIQVGDTLVTVAGENLDNIQAVRYLGNLLPFVINSPIPPLTTRTISFDIPFELSAIKGTKGFEVVLKDGSTLSLKVTVNP